MKTVFINCSPKKRFSASEYFIGLQRLFVRGEKVTEKLRNKGDHKRILDKLQDGDTVIFCTPLYVDGLPSHLLMFLSEMEKFCTEKNIGLRIYSISNNGFIEGCQSEPILRIFRNFCERSGLEWCGGVGIGGGVMLNVTRLMFVLQIASFIINLIQCFANGGIFSDVIIDFCINVLILLFFNSGVIFQLARMGSSINKKSFFGKKYTRIMIPSFIFMIFTDIFFTIISIFCGGVFRGWLSKKQVTAELPGASE